ncbi:MAG: quinone-dependent dihydroorotate dehydrogenase [Anaerolineae bacterium]|nr:MAG: quinone-dependent dihydroorotate dehydrogenase [Anaerolineae bacterium]WKZ44114.1 MAG: quinone-dependent dihydroorotate dehydrogenase [Anaerolineales bacterium]
MYSLFRPLLFALDPETSHQLTLQLLRVAGDFPLSNFLLSQLYKIESKPVHAFGLKFKNPIGLAAGYDKDGVAVRGLAALGFGHIEVGTVTPQAQAGNPRPRVFRLVEDEAVINRMGFPSKGMEYVSRRLLRLDLDTAKSTPTRPAARNDIILGINLGKNKDTPLEEAAQDYIKLMKVFAPLADYLTINISSPNTVGLRRLQGREMLEGLLGEIANARVGAEHAPPLLVKISPDMSEEELDDAVGVILDKKMDGIISANTTISREGIWSNLKGENGGLSGSPLKGRSEAVLRQVVKRVEGKVPIVSVGGIASPEEAKKRLALGASLVQVYTGLIYRGPGLVKQILKNL